MTSNIPAYNEIVGRLIKQLYEMESTTQLAKIYTSNAMLTLDDPTLEQETEVHGEAIPDFIHRHFSASNWSVLQVDALPGNAEGTRIVASVIGIVSRGSTRHRFVQSLIVSQNGSWHIVNESLRLMALKEKSKPVVKHVEKHVEEPTEKPMEKPLEKPVAKPSSPPPKQPTPPQKQPKQPTPPQKQASSQKSNQRKVQQPTPKPVETPSVEKLTESLANASISQPVSPTEKTTKSWASLASTLSTKEQPKKETPKPTSTPKPASTPKPVPTPTPNGQTNTTSNNRKGGKDECEVFIKGWHRSIPKEDLKKQMEEEFGQVLDIMIPFPDREFGYVEFSSLDAAKKAIQVGQTTLQGRVLRIVEKRRR